MENKICPLIAVKYHQKMKEALLLAQKELSEILIENCGTDGHSISLTVIKEILFNLGKDSHG